MQLRASSAGFSFESLAEAAELLHANGRRLYITVNSFAENDEIEKIGPYVRELKSLGADACIVSDIGAVSEIKEKVPEMEVHLSTQANCMNYKAAEVYRDLGVARIVLARELSLEKIAELRALTPPDLQLEAFVHGAMCMSYSGRCLLSSFLTGRSANRGECAQSCRWNYYLMEEKRPGEYFPVEEGPQGSAILSSKELCCIDILDRLEAAGVRSFKIEGRMRTPFYIGTVVNAYRMALDGKAGPGALRKELETTSHRPFCTGFYLNDPVQTATASGGYIRDWLFVAAAMEDCGGGSLRIQTRNPFEVGDELEILTPGFTGRKFTVQSIVDSERQSLTRSNTPMRVMTIQVPFPVRAGDIIRKREKQNG